VRGCPALYKNCKKDGGVKFDYLYLSGASGSYENYEKHSRLYCESSAVISCFCDSILFLKKLDSALGMSMLGGDSDPDTSAINCYCLFTVSPSGAIVCFVSAFCFVYASSQQNSQGWLDFVGLLYTDTS
jgi:hypothetical protein